MGYDKGGRAATLFDAGAQHDLMKTRTLIGVALLAAAGGCRMCSDCCDYSPPVTEGPYATAYGRAGSVLSGNVVGSTPAEAVPLAAPVEATPPAAPITP